MRREVFMSFILLVFFLMPLAAQEVSLDTLFKNSYRTIDLMRNHWGVYRDSKIFEGEDYHPSSVASIGVGLIALCIADAMNWEENAEEKALLTLKTITGNNPPFNPDRNTSGYYRHWIDMETGKRAWNSEYSTIDSGILTCGALFCKKYFCDNNEIVSYVDLLWSSINWQKAIQNPETGGLYRVMKEDGSGDEQSITLPFNEYMIVAYLAQQQSIQSNSPAKVLWENFYETPQNLPAKSYQGYSLLTDHPSYFLSSFVIQFTYYLCNGFASNKDYMQYFRNARLADSLYWQQNKEAQAFEWGSGAGSSDEGGYHADAINKNSTLTFSPHIIAGFLPVYQDGKTDLVQLQKDRKAVYQLPGLTEAEILWRKSLNKPSWKANEVQGIDHSTMLFGLATLPEFLGADFFLEYNDFFSEPCSSPPIDQSVKKSYGLLIKYDKNTNGLTCSISNEWYGILEIRTRKLKKGIKKQVEKKEVHFEAHFQLEKAPQNDFYVEIFYKNKLLFKHLIDVD